MVMLNCHHFGIVQIFRISVQVRDDAEPEHEELKPTRGSHPKCRHSAGTGICCIFSSSFRLGSCMTSPPPSSLGWVKPSSIISLHACRLVSSSLGWLRPLTIISSHACRLASSCLFPSPWLLPCLCSLQLPLWV